MKSHKAPYYKHSPIGSLPVLAKVLGCKTADELINISNSADQLYKPGPPQVKDDGTIRETIQAKQPLKRIQKNIGNRLLKNVVYPAYLQGGIADKDSPRGPVVNAELHLRKKTVISQDVKKFFPSCSFDSIYYIWKNFFHFPHDVALCLTKLTTKDCVLPQGASSSTLLANLMFFDIESELVESFRKAGFTYTRYIDDITVSTNAAISSVQKNKVISSIIGMMAKWGVKPKRSKSSIVGSGDRQMVHSLIVNSSRPTLPIERRKSIETDLRELEKRFDSDKTSLEYRKKYDSLSGTISYLTRFHSKLGKGFRERLKRIRPIPHEDQINMLRRNIRWASRTPIRDRKSYGYSRVLNRLSSRVGAIKHARPREAIKLQNKIRKIRSTIS